MIRIEFTEKEKDLLSYERYHHPPDFHQKLKNQKQTLFICNGLQHILLGVAM